MPAPPRGRPGSLAATGLGAGLVLVAAARLVPLGGTDVHVGTVPPLVADLDPRVGPGTLPALALAVLAATGLPGRWSRRLRWGPLLVLTWLLGVAWTASLALVDGTRGIAGVLGRGTEYLGTAREVTDVPGLLAHFVERIPLDSPGHWPVHVAGHPPGAVLFFVLLDRLGLGTDLAAGWVVVLVAATTPVAVAVACRALRAERDVRLVLPLLVLGPFAVWQAVSADAVFAAVAAWGLAALAASTRGPATAPGRVLLAVLAGLLLGGCLLLSYGLALLGVLALAVAFLGRRWWPVPVAAAAATALLLGVAALGFAWWEALPVLRERYWAGLASERPTWYWLWADLAALVVSAGPVLAAALATAVPRLRAAAAARAPLPVLGAAALVTVLLADASLMSKAEVERIWLPFVPWLLLLTTALPPRWLRAGLVVQVVVALAVQHLLATKW